MRNFFAMTKTSKFTICVPDYVRGLIWCRHSNGSWAPPFKMDSDDKKDKTPQTFKKVNEA